MAQQSERAEEIREQLLSISEAVVDCQYQLEPEIWKPYGRAGWEKSIRDQHFHLSYLAEAVVLSDPSLFMDYVNWVKQLFAALRFPEKSLVTMLECTHKVIAEELPEEDGAEALACIDKTLTALKFMSDTPPTFLPDDAPYSDLAREYLELLLHGDRNQAGRLILDKAEGGMSVRDIYLHVFQPTQYEIGRLWQINKISVAREHFCTAATQMIMSQLYPFIFSTQKTGRRLITACVGGELHEMGARMLADFFEMEGWDTYYLGANTPSDAIIRELLDQEAHILGISVTMTFHTRVAAELIRQVRSSVAGETPILVGGYPLNVSSTLWKSLGADGSARDAGDALRLANRICEAARG
jgi:methanogenic corrinoid protein MtbC1